MRRIFTIMILTVISVVSAQIAFAADDELIDPSELLPKSVNNFSMDPPTWHSFAESGLYNYMNGGAEIFLEYGFDRGCAAEYSSSGKHLVVELFKMKTADAAYGVYTISNFVSEIQDKRSKTYKIDDPDDKVAKGLKGDNYNLVEDVAVEFFKGDIYGRIAINEADRFTLMSFANKIMGQIPKHASRPKVMTNLPSINKIPGSERYAVGIIGMNQILDLGRDDIYGLQSGVEIVSGEYRLAPGVYYSLIAIMYRNETICDDKYKALQTMFNSWEGYMPIAMPQIKTANQSIFLVRTPANDYMGFRWMGTRIEIFYNMQSVNHFKMILEKDPSISVTVPN